MTQAASQLHKSFMRTNMQNTLQHGGVDVWNGLDYKYKKYEIFGSSFQKSVNYIIHLLYVYQSLQNITKYITRLKIYTRDLHDLYFLYIIYYISFMFVKISTSSNLLVLI